MNAANGTITYSAASRSDRRARAEAWGQQHRRTVAFVRLAAGTVLLGVTALLLSRGDGWWAALPLAGATLHLTWGSWQLANARRGSSRSAR